MRKQIIKLIPVAVAALVLVGCGRDPKKPGSIYMPDMTYSNAYKAYCERSTTPEGKPECQPAYRLPELFRMVLSPMIRLSGKTLLC